MQHARIVIAVLTLAALTGCSTIIGDGSRRQANVDRDSVCARAGTNPCSTVSNEQLRRAQEAARPAPSKAGR